MSSVAEPLSADHIDAKSTVLHGGKIGLLTVVGVVLFAVFSSWLAPGLTEGLVQSVIVIVFGTMIAFLPAQWVAPEDADGIAKASLIGFVGTVVFTLADVAILRVINLYPWTWDAVGGGSGWWYLPVWWMLGTFVSWTGSMISAAASSRGGGGIVNLGLGSLVGTAVLTVVGALTGLLAFGPVLVGGSFVVTLAVWAIVRLIRSGADA